MRKFFSFLWNAGATLFWGGVILFVPIWLLGLLMASGCSFDEYEELYSPDKSMRAVVINADCGATTNWQTQVYVEKVDGSRKTDNLIRLNGHPKDTNYQISWLNDKEFLISGFDFDEMLGFKNQSWGINFVRVHFKVNGS